MLQKAINFLNKNRHLSLLIVFILIYLIYFTLASFLRYDNFYTGRFDLGNMDQAVWNTIHGRIFQITDPNGTNIISRLAFHADFILILISPLYLFWADPKALLFLQTIVLSFGAIFVYLISKELLKSKNLSLIFSFAYLINPSINYANLYDFHPVTLGTTLLLALFYFFLKKKYVFFLIVAILAGLTKEHVWAIISLFGIAVILRILKEASFSYKKIVKQLPTLLFAFLITVFSMLFFYLLIWKVIPDFRGGNHFALSYYSDFGNSASSVTLNILFSPIKTLYIVLRSANINYLFDLFFPLGFLSFFSPLLLLLALPDFVINLLSNNAQLHEIYYQYTSTITPFVFIAAIAGASVIRKKFVFISEKVLILYLISTALLSAYFFGPLPLAKSPDISMFTKQLSNKADINDFLESIPTKYSVAATNNLGSHLSRRQKIYTIPVGIDKADVVLFLLNDPFAQPSLKAQIDTAKKLESDKNYLQIYKSGDFIVFEKRNLYLNNEPKPKKGQVKLFPYSIPALAGRSYMERTITIERNVPSSGKFRSYVVSFISDGLKEYALLNIPNSSKPKNGYPVLILDHGYIQPSQYDTVNSYKSESDYFANKGFLVIKPDYRGNGNSEITDTALMRFAYPIDVLNLLSSVKNIPEADSSQIFFWSHSMGGEVTLEVLEAISKSDLAPSVKAAVFWAPVTDPVKWFSKQNLPSLPETYITPFPYQKTFQILGTPEENPQLWEALSPLNYLKDINVPILLQHGTADESVPYTWSVELNEKLSSLGKNIKFLSYPNNNHNLSASWNKAINDDMLFFNNYLH